MKLIVKDDLYISNDSDLVSTLFYLEYEGYVFPDSKWTDFPYPVLQNWAWMILKKKYIPFTSFELLFMDGPYKLVCKKVFSRLHVQCVQFGKTNSVKYHFSCTIIDFLQAISRAMLDLECIIHENEVLGNSAKLQKVCIDITSMQTKISRQVKRRVFQSGRYDFK